MRLEVSSSNPDSCMYVYFIKKKLYLWNRGACVAGIFLFFLFYCFQNLSFSYFLKIDF